MLKSLKAFSARRQARGVIGCFAFCTRVKDYKKLRKKSKTLGGDIALGGVCTRAHGQREGTERTSESGALQEPMYTASDSDCSSLPSKTLCWQGFFEMSRQSRDLREKFLSAELLVKRFRIILASNPPELTDSEERSGWFYVFSAADSGKSQ